MSKAGFKNRPGAGAASGGQSPMQEGGGMLRKLLRRLRRGRNDGDREDAGRDDSRERNYADELAAGQAHGMYGGAMMPPSHDAPENPAGTEPTSSST
jgi:hypothetical protein